jgi:hypothetical protein
MRLTDDHVITLARLQRAAVAAVRARMTREQLGLAFDPDEPLPVRTPLLTSIVPHGMREPWRKR